MRGLPFDRRVEELLADRDDLASIVRPMLAAWRQLREQVAVGSVKNLGRYAASWIAWWPNRPSSRAALT